MLFSVFLFNLIRQCYDCVTDCLTFGESLQGLWQQVQVRFGSQENEFMVSMTLSVSVDRKEIVTIWLRLD